MRFNVSIYTVNFILKLKTSLCIQNNYAIKVIIRSLLLQVLSFQVLEFSFAWGSLASSIDTVGNVRFARCACAMLASRIGYMPNQT